MPIKLRRLRSPSRSALSAISFATSPKPAPSVSKAAPVSKERTLAPRRRKSAPRLASMAPDRASTPSMRMETSPSNSLRNSVRNNRDRDAKSTRSSASISPSNRATWSEPLNKLPLITGEGASVDRRPLPARLMLGRSAAISLANFRSARSIVAAAALATSSLNRLTSASARFRSRRSSAISCVSLEMSFRNESISSLTATVSPWLCAPTAADEATSNVASRRAISATSNFEATMWAFAASCDTCCNSLRSCATSPAISLLPIAACGAGTGALAVARAASTATSAERVSMRPAKACVCCDSCARSRANRLTSPKTDSNSPLNAATSLALWGRGDSAATLSACT
mmetsp:Transcript_46808/g.134851  ORF Transcript_46808/g.134851 Transcript_46808/m.134851 type:complete len:343 (-) Transcript_46808:1011-2039(-)